jgi:excisionase family DNA binding protein
MSQHASTNCEPKMFTVIEVAEILKCSERHVYRLEEKGLMPEGVRPGSIVRWQQERISAWINAGCPPTVAV